MISILVTGGAGYIGSHICKTLKLSGYLPVTLDDLSCGHLRAVQWGPLEKGNIKNEDWVREVIKKYKPLAVIHCSGFISVSESVSNPAIYYENNVSSSISLLNAIIKENVKHIVFSSTCAIHGNPNKVSIDEDSLCSPITPYGNSKYIVEQILKDYAKAYDLTYTALRYFNASGADINCQIGEMHNPETHVIPLALEAADKNKEFTIFGTDYPTADGTAIRDYIHVTDLAQAHLLATNYLKDGGKSCAINIGTGNGTSVKILSETIARITKKDLKVKIAPRRQGDPAQLIANPILAKELLKFNPKFSDIDTIVQTAWDWYQLINKENE